MNAHDTRLLIDLLNERSTIVLLEYIELKAQGHSERDLKQHSREIAHIAQLERTLKERQQ
jgi:predicted nucleotidyltransferase